MRRAKRLGTRAALLVAGLVLLSACTAGSDPTTTVPYDPNDPPDRVTTTQATTTTADSTTTTVSEETRRAELTEIVADHLLASFTALHNGDADAFRATLYDDFAWDNIDGDSALAANLGLSGPPSRPEVTLGTIHIDQPDCFVADVSFQVPERSQADEWPGATFRQTDQGTWTRASRSRQWRCDVKLDPGDIEEIQAEVENSMLLWLRAVESSDDGTLRQAHGVNEVFFESVRDEILPRRQIRTSDESSITAVVEVVEVNTNTCLIVSTTLSYGGIIEVVDGAEVPLEPDVSILGFGRNEGWRLDGSWGADSNDWACFA